jgi:hypothetical protein
MKIINKTEFYKLPSGTLYNDFTPNVFMGLKIKLETLENDNYEPIDFMYQEIIGNVELKCEDVLSGEFKNDYNEPDRDGMYEKNQMFAIYDQKDVKMLIHKLQSLILK